MKIPLYYSVRSLWARRLSTGLTVLGLGLVVFVLAAVLMLSHGIEAALASGGSPDNLVALREGADTEIVSAVERETVQLLSTEPELASGADGAPLIAGERVVLVGITREGATANVTVRGISAESLAIRPTVRIVEGRAPRAGSNEVAIGSALAGRLPGAEVGGELRFGEQVWPVVGKLDAKGSAFDSEIWADGDRVGAVFTRPEFSSAVLRLANRADAQQLLDTVARDPRFKLKVLPEDRYWANQATGMATFIRVLGLFVVFIFSIGAALGAMITMYAQVASRVRELGTLRALGFRRRSVLASVLVESTLLGLAGGLLGSVAALGMRWVRFRTLNFQTFSEITFSFVPSAPILLGALVFGAMMGLFGGMLPALRAARLGVLDALRA